MSVVWEDEYDPSELDGFQVETEDGLEDENDAASLWLEHEAMNNNPATNGGDATEGSK